ncbi:nicotinate-nucleotide adenylyltransferase [Bacillus sp. JCM 19041]|uniref:nicotinate-nicotinamide nucleotide adenylyltransferase n=1 Tax=Bacillus sp. JCM 19041 TaxID=1460637 RepID=UPI000A6A0479
MKRVGLFGGTFDPPHIGHMLIAQEALSVVELDEIWFIPVSIPPHKKRAGITSAKNRYQMVEAALTDEPQFKTSDIELKRQGKSYTIDTVRQLKNEYPTHDFFFLSVAIW